MAIQITLYKRVYKPRLRSKQVDPAIVPSANVVQKEDDIGHEYAIIYDVLGKTVNAESEVSMTHNEVYGFTESIAT